MRHLLRLLILCLWPCLAMAATDVAGAGWVIVVSSESSPLYVEAGKNLVEALARGGIARDRVAQISVDDVRRRNFSRLAAPGVFVALGSQATQALLSADIRTPVLSTLIPRRSFEQIVLSSGPRAAGQIGVIYLDQPLRRQVALLQLALPQAQQIGVLLGPDSIAKLRELGALTQARDLTLRHALVTRDEDLFPALREALEGSAALLALADPLVFNSANIRNILLASFRAKVPMLAFSPAYARAGAVLSLYTTVAQVAAQTAREVQNMLMSGRGPDHPLEPDDFEVAVNQNVARSLGLTLDAQALRQALRRVEQLP